MLDVNFACTLSLFCLPSFFAVILTSLNRDHWKVWKNGAGVTGTIRRHLTQNHLEIYNKVSKIANLKHSTDNPTTSTDTTKEPFTIERWLSRLMKWVVVDDQVLFKSLFGFSSTEIYYCSPSMLLTAKNFGNSRYMVARMFPKATSLIEQNSSTRSSKGTNLSVKSYSTTYR